MTSTVVARSYSIRKIAVFELCVALSQIFGFAMVILSGESLDNKNYCLSNYGHLKTAIFRVYVQYKRTGNRLAI